MSNRKKCFNNEEHEPYESLDGFDRGAVIRIKCKKCNECLRLSWQDIEEQRMSNPNYKCKYG